MSSLITAVNLISQRDTVRAASEFAARNQLPPRIQEQMLSHICLKFKTEGLKQQETLNGLPKAIRSSIADYLFHPIAQRAYLFRGVSQDFLFQLVRLHMLHIILFLPSLFLSQKYDLLESYTGKR